MQSILTKGFAFIRRAALREFREPASFISLKEGGKILFYSCLIFFLCCVLLAYLRDIINVCCDRKKLLEGRQ